MRSTRSPASSAAADPREGERGSAVVEFSMIAVLLTAIFLVVLQVGLYLYQRSVISSSALAAARYAANANVPSIEAEGRANELISDALSSRVADAVHCGVEEETGEGGLRIIVVECSGALPSIVAALGDVMPVKATARVLEEGQ